MKNAISLNISKLPDYQLNKVVNKLNKICFNKGWRIEFLKKKYYTDLIYEGIEQMDENGFISGGWKLTGYTSENGERANVIKLADFLKL